MGGSRTGRSGRNKNFKEGQCKAGERRDRGELEIKKEMREGRGEEQERGQEKGQWRRREGKI